MDSDLYNEIQGIEDVLRQQASDASNEAERMRHEATLLDGRAAGFLAAATMLRNIERPQ